MYNHGFLFFGALGIVVSAGCSTTVIVGTGASSTGASGTGATATGASGTGATATGGSGTGASGSSTSTASGTTGSTLSCDVDVSGTHVCSEYEDLPPRTSRPSSRPARRAVARSGTACPSADRLGTCTIVAGGITAKEAYYSGGSLTAATAESACSSGGGTWTAG